MIDDQRRESAESDAFGVNFAPIPGASREHLRAASERLAAGDAEAAGNLVLSFLESAPRDIGGLRVLARAAVKTGDPALLERAAGELGLDGDARAVMSELTRQGRSEPVAAFLVRHGADPVIAESPVWQRVTGSFVRLAHGQLKAGEVPQGHFALLCAAVRMVRPDDVLTQRLAGRAARQWAAELGTLPPQERVASARRILMIDPHNVRAILTLALASLDAGRPDEAWRMFDALAPEDWARSEVAEIVVRTLDEMPLGPARATAVETARLRLAPGGFDRVRRASLARLRVAQQTGDVVAVAFFRATMHAGGAADVTDRAAALAIDAVERLLQKRLEAGDVEAAGRIWDATGHLVRDPKIVQLAMNTFYSAESWNRAGYAARRLLVVAPGREFEGNVTLATVAARRGDLALAADCARAALVRNPDYEPMKRIIKYAESSLASHSGAA